MVVAASGAIQETRPKPNPNTPVGSFGTIIYISCMEKVLILVLCVNIWMGSTLYLLNLYVAWVCIWKLYFVWVQFENELFWNHRHHFFSALYIYILNDILRSIMIIEDKSGKVKMVSFISEIAQSLFKTVKRGILLHSRLGWPNFLND